tara:strand:- start:19896 stop:21689 length:1794 start_codon:yes stop_codon:yes gene_type:complete
MLDTERSLDEALATLHHRGPDASGRQISDDRFRYFGHRRLSVIDLSIDGNQPMQKYGWTLIFNGEIYNYLSLKERLLGLGYTFETNSDTEVLLVGWHHFGKGVLDLIDGMFAFVIEKDGVIYAAVDPFGEKPLYWFEDGRGIFIASEINAFRKLKDLHPSKDPAELLEFFLLGYTSPPHTGFSGINRLSPATLMIVKDGRCISRTQYWQFPEFDPNNLLEGPPTDQEIKSVKDALCVSMERRLISDAPLCLFLSSGTDSTLMAALSVVELGIKPDTITFEIKGKLSGSIAIEEAQEARKIAEKLGLHHEVISVDALDLSYSIEDLVSLFGVLNDNSGALALKAICAVARSKCVVGLTGVGGDELSFGYGKSVTLYRLRHMYSLPEGLLKLLWKMARVFSGLSNRLEGLSEHASPSFAEIYLSEKNLPAYQAFAEKVDVGGWPASRFGKKGVSPYYTAGWEDMVNTLPGTILLGQDHASMSESMELRSPYLSKDVFQAMAAIGARRHLLGGRKYVLGKIRDQYLSRAEFPSRKHGFLYSSSELLRKAPPLEIQVFPKEFREIIFQINQRATEGRGWTKFAIRSAIYQTWQKQFSNDLG